MPRKFHRDADRRFDNRRRGCLKRSEYYEGVLIGLAVDAPDQKGGYHSLTPTEKIREWSSYSAQVFAIAGDMNNQLRSMNK